MLELQQKAIEMAKYYYKGFGAIMDGILSNAELYLRHKYRKDFSEQVYRWLKEIEDFYSTIPFETLKGKEEFFPLFIVKSLLPKLQQRLDVIFKDGTIDDIKDLERMTTTIVDVGTLYWDTLIQLLHEIRAFPEAKDFRVAIPDQNRDYIWHF